MCVSSVTGRLVDEKAAPLGADLLVTVCGNACFYGTVGADGAFTVPLRYHVPVADYAVSVHAGPARASAYFRVPALVGEAAAFRAPLVVPLLPSDGPALKLDRTAESVASMGVTLSFAAGTVVMLSLEDVEQKELGRRFRAAPIAAPATLALDWPRSDPPEQLYAFAPFEALFAPPAMLSFPNRAAAPAGTRYGVYAMRALDTEKLPAGTFDRIAGAQVSGDATTIQLDAGAGFSTLTWVAIYRE